MARSTSKSPVTSGRKSAGKPGREADLDLWDRVAKTITPLPSTTERLNEIARLTEDRPPLQPAKRQKPPKGVTGAPKQKASTPSKPTPLPAPSRPAAYTPPPDYSAPAEPRQARGRVAGLDRRTAERFRKGALPIDSRLDLHGLNREQAHAALRLFVRQCHAAGKRCLLVITGKGARGRPEADNPYTTPEPPGRLKREVPGWLASGDLAPMILSTAAATQRDGGGGALYILLRRRREDRS
ncbi:MAG: Smr/MutS family protein [Minwuia sp.]|nr:Smr/MutS family protein [Minwuia sp.]